MSIDFPDLTDHCKRTPIIIDDIVSSGTTLQETARLLLQQRFVAPNCIVVHPLIDTQAWRRLKSAHFESIVSCNTIPHASNAIDLSPAIAEVAQFALNSIRGSGTPIAVNAAASNERPLTCKQL